MEREKETELSLSAFQCCQMVPMRSKLDSDVLTVKAPTLKKKKMQHQPCLSKTLLPVASCLKVPWSFSYFNLAALASAQFWNRAENKKCPRQQHPGSSIHNSFVMEERRGRGRAMTCGREWSNPEQLRCHTRAKRRMFGISATLISLLGCQRRGEGIKGKKIFMARLI